MAWGHKAAGRRNRRCRENPSETQRFVLDALREQVVDCRFRFNIPSCSPRVHLATMLDFGSDVERRSWSPDGTDDEFGESDDVQDMELTPPASVRSPSCPSNMNMRHQRTTRRRSPDTHQSAQFSMYIAPGTADPDVGEVG
ncbi:hypothetical protein FOMPIDRAFT_1017429 [Fomitopsis schrenkii]|uniref:Uncharacterized protein n=1 Tax=Fomitopsis schrenkii TaxID=2126942 RepID=S8E149_FOMSC|nr:hypothetical protein FOMPIDRAFT_1017429 [Fomitopsis schrenkii]